MADSEKLQIDITADAKQAAKEIDGLTKKAEGLEKLDPEIEVQADTSGAAKALDGITSDAKELDSIHPEIQVDADVQRVITAFDDVVAETKRVAAAADQLGAALGPELAAQADTVRVVQGLKDMGLTMDQIEGNAEELGAKLRDLADSDVGGKMGAALGTARGQLDEVSKSADSSKSALANMVGNSAQDLGNLGGVAGSTGVLIGQMAEYMADAKFEGEGLKSIGKNFASIAGPAAAIIAVVSVFNEVLSDSAKRSEAAAKLQETFAKALEHSSDEALGLTDAMRENASGLRRFDADARTMWGGFVEGATKAANAIPLLGAAIPDDAAQNVTNVAKALNDASISAYEFNKQVAKGEDGVAILEAMADAAQMNGDITAAQAEAIKQFGKQSVDAFKGATENLDLFNVSQDEANALLQQMLRQQNPLSQFTDKWKVLTDDMADGAIDTEDAADAVNFLAKNLGITQEKVIDLASSVKAVDPAFGVATKALEEWTEATARGITGMDAYDKAVRSVDWGASGLDAAVTAMSTFSDQHFGLIDIAADAEEAYDKFSESVKSNGKTFDVTTDKGRANQSALEDVARTLDTKLAAAYKDAGGDMDVFKTKAGAISKEAIDRLMPALKNSGISAEDLAGMLGLLPEDIETRYQLSGTEDAKAKIGLLQSAIDNLPEDVQTQVTQKIIVGDYVGALKIVQDYYGRNPADMATEAKPPSFGSIIGAGLAVSNHFANNPVPIATTATAPGNLSAIGKKLKGATGGTARRGRTTVAGEAGDEFVRLPDGTVLLLTAETVVPPGTRITSARKTREILHRRRTDRRATGTTPGAVPVVTTQAAPMTFVYQQQAPVYGVEDLDRHLAAWGQQIAQQIAVGRRS